MSRLRLRYRPSWLLLLCALGCTECFAPKDQRTRMLAGEPGLHLVGRHQVLASGAVAAAWSGTGFVARFRGTGFTWTQQGGPTEYTVLVDGALGHAVVTREGRHEYVAAVNLHSGEHQVEVYRRSEALFGPTTVSEVRVHAGQLLASVPTPSRRLELIGDSISCGYGNEGKSPTCPFSAATENHYLTYGALLARSLSAELSTIAWSGKGIVRNYGGEQSPTLPDLYERALPSEASSRWDFAKTPPPDAVVINLGTNDYSTEPAPTDATFIAAYVQFLMTIRARYPGAYILATIGPLLSGASLKKARQNLQSAVGARVQAGDAKVAAHILLTENTKPGCDWHPGLETHAAMARELREPLRLALTW